MKSNAIINKILIYFFVILFFFLSPSVYSPHKIQFTSFNALPAPLKQEIITFITKDRLYLVNAGSIYQILLTLPFLDYDDHSYTINYSDSSMQLFHNNILLQEKDIQSDTYIKISYPYFFSFNTISFSLAIYSLLSPSDTPLVTLNGSDFFSSFGASPNGKYIIAGDLSGKIYLYSTLTRQLTTKTFENMKHPFIQGVGINDEGNYYAIGGYNSKLLEFGNIHYKESDSIKLKNTQTNVEQLLFTKDLAFLPLKKGFEAFDFKKGTFSESSFPSLFYPLVFAKEMSNSSLLLLGYKVNDHSFEFTLIHKKKILQSFFIYSHSVPAFRTFNHQNYLISESGVVIL